MDEKEIMVEDKIMDEEEIIDNKIMDKEEIIRNQKEKSWMKEKLPV